MLRVAMSQGGCEIWTVEFVAETVTEWGWLRQSPGVYMAFFCAPFRSRHLPRGAVHCGFDTWWVARRTCPTQAHCGFAQVAWLGTYLWLSTDSCDDLSKWSKCLLLVWLINRNSLRAPSCLVFKTLTKLLSCSSAPSNITRCIWKWGAPWCPKSPWFHHKLTLADEDWGNNPPFLHQNTSCLRPILASQKDECMAAEVGRGP